MEPREFVKAVDDAVDQFLRDPKTAPERENILDDPELAAAARAGFESNPVAKTYAKGYAAGAAAERGRLDEQAVTGHPLLAAALIERRRQVEVEGYTDERDDEHHRGELARAAVAYALAHTPLNERSLWPWSLESFRPSTAIDRNLVKAVALLLAEFDRLNRRFPPVDPEGE